MYLTGLLRKEGNQNASILITYERKIDQKCAFSPLLTAAKHRPLVRFHLFTIVRKQWNNCDCEFVVRIVWRRRKI